MNCKLIWLATMIYSNYLRDRATAMIVMVNIQEIFVIRACYTSGLMRCTKPCSSTYAAVLASKTYMLTVHDRYTYWVYLPHAFTTSIRKYALGIVSSQ